MIRAIYISLFLSMFQPCETELSQIHVDYSFTYYVIGKDVIKYIDFIYFGPIYELLDEYCIVLVENHMDYTYEYNVYVIEYG